MNRPAPHLRGSDNPAPTRSLPLVALFCGSRDWTDVVAVRIDVDALPDGSVVIEGGQRGADRIARAAAHDRGLHVATVDWRPDLYGRAAGYKRNAAMWLLRPAVVYAYPHRRPDGSYGGTGHSMDWAIKNNVELHVREVPVAA